MQKRYETEVTKLSHNNPSFLAVHVSTVPSLLSSKGLKGLIGFNTMLVSGIREKCECVHINPHPGMFLLSIFSTRDIPTRKSLPYYMSAPQSHFYQQPMAGFSQSIDCSLHGSPVLLTTQTFYPIEY